MSVMLMAIVCEPLIVELHIVEPSHISQLTSYNKVTIPKSQVTTAAKLSESS